MLTLGLGVREAWRQAEEQRFKELRELALTRLDRELASEVGRLRNSVNPRCDSDSVVDMALVGLQNKNLANYLTPISLGVRDLLKALSVDELLLITSEGEILGSAHADDLGERFILEFERERGVG